MSLVIAIRSYLPFIDLQSISSSVVLPEPTGPPMPTRRGGSFLVRLAMWCSAEDMSLASEETGILGFVTRGIHREHRREGLALVVAESERMVDRTGDFFGQPAEHALPRALTERHRLDGGAHHVLGPAEREGQAAVAHAGLGAARSEGEGHGVGDRQ